MKQKWVVYVTHGVYVDVEDKVLDPDMNVEDYEELRTRAALKIWEQGYEVVRTEADMEYEDVSEEFGIKGE